MLRQPDLARSPDLLQLYSWVRLCPSQLHLQTQVALTNKAIFLASIA
jgi:hypothetical protein